MVPTILIIPEHQRLQLITVELVLFTSHPVRVRAGFDIASGARSDEEVVWESVGHYHAGCCSSDDAETVVFVNLVVVGIHGGGDWVE